MAFSFLFPARRYPNHVVFCKGEKYESDTHHHSAHRKLNRLRLRDQAILQQKNRWSVANRSL